MSEIDVFAQAIVRASERQSSSQTLRVQIVALFARERREILNWWILFYTSVVQVYLTTCISAPCLYSYHYARCYLLSVHHRVFRLRAIVRSPVLQLAMALVAPVRHRVRTVCMVECHSVKVYLSLPEPTRVYQSLPESIQVYQSLDFTWRRTAFVRF